MLEPEELWQTRLDALTDDLRRLDALLSSAPMEGTRHRFGQLLAPLEQGLQRLPAQAQAGAPWSQRWQALSALAQKVQAAATAQLEMLGGMAMAQGIRPQGGEMDGGYSRQAEAWLRALYERTGLAGDFVVRSGRFSASDGTKVPTTIGLRVVGLPFLDWDLWHMPLLARDVGLLAGGEEPFRALLEEIAGEGQDLLGLQSLLAEIVAMALAGPVYALAVFALELDYLAPASVGDGTGLSTTDRAATILYALQHIDDAYAGAAQQMSDLWVAALKTTGQNDGLPAAADNLRPWLQRLVEDVGLAHLPVAARAPTPWIQARSWFRALAGAEEWPVAPPLAPGTDTTTALLGGLWLHRLRFPQHAGAAHATAAVLLCGEALFSPQLQGSPAKSHEAAAQARLATLAGQRERLAALLQHAQVADEDRAAVAGRFYRLLSDQQYGEALTGSIMRQGGVRRGVWSKLASHGQDAIRWRQEALAFFGGLFLYYRELDREPPLSQDDTAGPSASRVAASLLRAYARATGVNWNARTVPGPDPFVAVDTEVIRTRFPDWSLWSLPLMAHEFGHLVAFNTPAFRDYQAEQQPSLLRDHPRPPLAAGGYEQARLRHLDELFADMFALFTFGPAYATCLFALYLDPATAYAPRGAHPSHDERAAATIQALRAMDRQGGDGLYAPLAGRLEAGWEDGMNAFERAPLDSDVHAFLKKQTLRWADRCLTLVDRFYRLGARFEPGDWQLASALAKSLYPQPPEPAKLAALAEPFGRPSVTLRHLVNALWLARAAKPQQAGYLGQVGERLAQALLPALEERRTL